MKKTLKSRKPKTAKQPRSVWVIRDGQRVIRSDATRYELDMAFG